MTDLSTLHGCLQELEDCSNGLLWFDHLYGRVLDDIRISQGVWDAVEADALAAAREGAPKGSTATEIKGRVTHWVNQRPSAQKAREELHDAEVRKEKIERWVRSLERRIGSAQTAKGIHEQLAHGGGGG